MSAKRKIIMGADHAGLALKDELKAHLEAGGYEVRDLGTNDTASTDYPDYAHRVASAVAQGEGLGILVCGMGVGMSMAANRHEGVRAALCADTFSARMTRLHNDANVLCLGARVVGGGLAQDVVDSFLGAEFEGGRHARRVSKIEPNGSREG
ncbi:MAG: ribose 5-phosphate isomerase B [Polyangiaceae bacterium]|nr:ribose 5-phosphate isomerase B [Polyangiaceae bacterium]